MVVSSFRWTEAWSASGWMNNTSLGTLDLLHVYFMHDVELRAEILRLRAVQDNQSKQDREIPEGISLAIKSGGCKHCHNTRRAIKLRGANAAGHGTERGIR